METLTGKVAIVTGAGRGIGRSEALLLAREGTCVVVNGRAAPSADGRAAAEIVAEEIRATGGRAVAYCGNVSDWATAQALVDAALEEFGRLDALVCKAGDRPGPHGGEPDGAGEWTDVVEVNLTGHLAPLRAAAAYWRDRTRAGEGPVGAHVVLTISPMPRGSPGRCSWPTGERSARWCRGRLALRLAETSRGPSRSCAPGSSISCRTAPHRRRRCRTSGSAESRPSTPEHVRRSQGAVTDESRRRQPG